MENKEFNMFSMPWTGEAAFVKHRLIAELLGCWGLKSGRLLASCFTLATANTLGQVNQHAHLFVRNLDL